MLFRKHLLRILKNRFMFQILKRGVAGMPVVVPVKDLAMDHVSIRAMAAVVAAGDMINLIVL